MKPAGIDNLGMQNGAGSLENNLAVSYNVKDTLMNSVSIMTV